MKKGKYKGGNEKCLCQFLRASVWALQKTLPHPEWRQESTDGTLMFANQFCGVTVKINPP